MLLLQIVMHARVMANHIVQVTSSHLERDRSIQRDTLRCALRYIKMDCYYYICTAVKT